MVNKEEAAHVTLVQFDQPFEMLQGSYVRQRFAPHLHDTYSVGVIDRGAARLRYRGADVTFVPGDVIALEPNEVHTGEPVDAQGWSYRMLYLPTELVSGLGNDDTGAPRFAQSRYPDAELANQLRALHHLLEREPDILRQGSALASTLHALCERHADPSASHSTRASSAALGRVRAYLEAHYARVVTLAELASLAGLSSFHLIRQFRLAFGLPPYMYLELIRINRAKEMLQQGARISDVAYATGFSDQSHMTRRFKRVFGVPPGQYAKSYWAAMPKTTPLAMPQRRLA
jgi:AraC-like DNA-binding protein